ncbi:MAG TPA: MMPL family transporter [Candidatus Binatia bacterium]|nr:MMPL family transporter [Candidatus Binatia bacterium]
MESRADESVSRALRWLLGRGRVPALIVVSVATLLAAFYAARVGVEHDNASLNADDAEQARVYADFKAAFGNDEDLLVALSHPRLLSADGLALLDEVSRTIAAADGVRRVWSLATAEEVVRGAVGAEPRAIVPDSLDAPEVEARVLAALDRNVDTAAWLVSPDRRTAGIVVEIEDRPEDPEYRHEIITTIRDLGTRIGGGGVALRLTGVSVQKHDVSVYVDRDQRILMPLAVLVMALTLAAFFRTVSGVLLPLGVAGAAVVCTLGLYGATGHALNAITSLLPAVLLVVAVAASVHVYDFWREAHEEGGADTRGARAARVTRAVLAVMVPTALCAVTTAQGFLSLTVSAVPAVRQFGLFAAFGVVTAFAVGMTVLPVLLTYLPKPPPSAEGEHGLTLRMLDASARFATTRPIAVVAAFTVVTVVAAAGIPLVRANTDLVAFLRDDAPLRLDTEAIDSTLGGVLPVDFVVRRADGGSVVTSDALGRIERVEASMRARAGVAGTASATALVRQVHRAEADDARLALPQDDGRLQGYVDLLEESGHPLWRRFVARDARAIRVSARLRSMGTAESGLLITGIVAEARDRLGADYTITPTGSLYHVIRDSDHLVEQQVRSFGGAIVLVVLSIGVLFRSVRFTVLAMIPNVMPIVWTGGLMGYAGIELSTGTAMIASAVLGLVVDDTIHYLSRYRRVYAGDVVAAIHATTRTVGAPVTVAAVSLVLGFWVGAFGSFRPTIYFSLLTGLTMITGVLCDLLLLPATLVLLKEKRGLSPFSEK